MQPVTKIGLSFLCFAVGLTAFLTNSAVIAVFLRGGKTIRPIHCYLLSDTLTNILTSLGVLVLGIALPSFDINSCFCEYFLEPMFIVTLIAGSCSIAVIAAERFRALVLLRLPVSVTKRVLILFFIWTSAIACLLVHVFLVETEPIPSGGGDICNNTMIRCPGDCFIDHRVNQIFATSIVIVFYVTPMLVSLRLYLAIILKLWKRKELGSLNNQEKKMQAVQAMAYILIVYTLCWLPFIVYHLYVDWDESGKDSEFHPSELGLFILGCSQSALSTLVYINSCQDFRENLYAALKRFAPASKSSAVARVHPSVITCQDAQRTTRTEDKPACVEDL